MSKHCRDFRKVDLVRISSRNIYTNRNSNLSESFLARLIQEVLFHALFSKDLNKSRKLQKVAFSSVLKTCSVVIYFPCKTMRKKIKKGTFSKTKTNKIRFIGESERRFYADGKKFQNKRYLTCGDDG